MLTEGANSVTSLVSNFQLIFFILAVNEGSHKIVDWTNLNFAHKRPLSTALAAIERLKI